MFSSAIGLTIIAATLAILLLIAGVVITIIVSNHRNEKQETKMTVMQLDHERGLREVQEYVMAGVAKDLHDNIGLQMTFMSLELQRIKMLNPTIANAVRPIEEQIDNTRAEVSMLSKSLNSELIETNGLIYTIEQEVGRVQKLNKYDVRLEHDETNPEFNKEQKIIVFRIFQEIMNNTLKHAQGKNIYISFRGRNGFEMIISDDGKGFDLAQMMGPSRGSGLKNIKGRAERAKLVCTIESEINKGTTFTFKQ